MLDELINNLEENSYFAIHSKTEELLKNKILLAGFTEQEIRTVNDICSTILTYDGRYEPLVCMNGKRSFLPEDLSDEEQNQCSSILNKTNNPLLRIRIKDFLWLKTKDYRYAQQVLADIRIEFNKNKNLFISTTEGTGLLHRGMTLAADLNYRNEPLIRDIKEFSSLLSNPLELDLNYEKINLQTFLLTKRLLNNQEKNSLINEVLNIYKYYKNEKNYSICANLINSILSLLNQDDEVRRKKRLSQIRGFCLIKDFEAFELLQIQASPDYLGLFFKIRSVHQEIIKMGHMYTLVKENISSKQRNYALLSKTQFKRLVSGPIHISNFMDSTVEKISTSEEITKDLLHELCSKIFTSFHSQDNLIELELKKLRTPSICDLTTGVSIDNDGLVAEINGAALTEEKRAELRSFKQEAIRQNFTGLLVEDGFKCLRSRPRNYANVFKELLRPPFVPVGRAEIYARGILHGIAGNYIECVHLLCPQIENSLRNILILKNVNVSYTDKDGVQRELDLNSILKEEKYFKNLPLDDNAIFFLRTLLVEKSGANLRNDVCHGRLTEHSFEQGFGASLLCITILLCLHFYRKNNGN